MPKVNPKIVLLSFFIFLTGLFLGWLLFSKKIFSAEKEACENNYKFIDPYVACEITEKDVPESFESLRSKIKEFTDYSINGGKATHVSVFLRDLDTKLWLGVNENENYSPASLLKLPILISYYKLSEVEPGILSKEYIYQGVTSTSDETQNIKPEVSLEKGKQYTTEELLYHMIAYSDNETLGPLSQFIGNDFLNKVFIDLGVYVPTGSGVATDFLSTKTYGAIFRTLYNSSYLNPQNSEKVLGLLTKTAFDQGLVAGLPAEITVAHKFGEREIDDPDHSSAAKALYDCGIVYYPGRPYVLCVMTKGNDWQKLEEIIKNISRLSYEEFNKK